MPPGAKWSVRAGKTRRYFTTRMSLSLSRQLQDPGIHRVVSNVEKEAFSTISPHGQVGDRGGDKWTAYMVAYITGESWAAGIGGRFDGGRSRNIDVELMVAETAEASFGVCVREV
ncbi:hypothetical protein CSOJ01_09623 [Colletotrichum sojae]|uniref:Uncharacterized protein n=1 Tax=Colletotrichum sojae TaxID=2175907 RepID=A0A8H6MQC7_9PEZI|nr:hypothetical protein CSOJ01_09623 [Colletotrichum sojae]